MEGWMNGMDLLDCWGFGEPRGLEGGFLTPKMLKTNKTLLCLDLHFIVHLCTPKDRL
jgi:hypothetical protein